MAKAYILMTEQEILDSAQSFESIDELLSVIRKLRKDTEEVSAQTFLRVLVSLKEYKPELWRMLCGMKVPHWVYATITDYPDHIFVEQERTRTQVSLKYVERHLTNAR